MNTTNEFPLYARIAYILIGLIAFFYILYIGQDIILPLIYAMILAIVMNPFVNYLTNKKVNRVLSIFIVLTLTLILLFGLIYFIVSQAAMFREALPQLKIKFYLLFDESISWLSKYFNISPVKINTWISNLGGEGLSNSTYIIGQTLSTISGFFILTFLMPVYVFMILFYKPLLLEFIKRLFSEEKHATINDILNDAKSLIQKYLLGLLIEMGLVAILNATGLLIIGIEYAILLGIIGAMLNIIPYIGGIIAIGLPMILALATKTPESALFVFISYSIVQFIDNNFIVPQIVASKVKINGLVSIIVVIIGGGLWGVPGMFLSIPLTAILKVILDRFDSVKAYGFLLGDTMPNPATNMFLIKNAKKKLKKN